MTTRNHKKRHGVGRERSRYDRRRHERALRKQAEHRAARERWSAIHRLYWAGDVPDWSTATQIVDQGRRWSARAVSFWRTAA